MVAVSVITAGHAAPRLGKGAGSQSQSRGWGTRLRANMVFLKLSTSKA